MVFERFCDFWLWQSVKRDQIYNICSLMQAKNIWRKGSLFLKTRGIVQRNSFANTPQPDEVAERVNRIVLNIPRAQLSEKIVPK